MHKLEADFKLMSGHVMLAFFWLVQQMTPNWRLFRSIGACVSGMRTADIQTSDLLSSASTKSRQPVAIEYKQVDCHSLVALASLHVPSSAGACPHACMLDRSRAWSRLRQSAD